MRGLPSSHRYSPPGLHRAPRQRMGPRPRCPSGLGLVPWPVPSASQSPGDVTGAGTCSWGERVSSGGGDRTPSSGLGGAVPCAPSGREEQREEHRAPVGNGLCVRRRLSCGRTAAPACLGGSVLRRCRPRLSPATRAWPLSPPSPRAVLSDPHIPPNVSGLRGALAGAPTPASVGQEQFYLQSVCHLLSSRVPVRGEPGARRAPPGGGAGGVPPGPQAPRTAGAWAGGASAPSLRLMGLSGQGRGRARGHCRATACRRLGGEGAPFRAWLRRLRPWAESPCGLSGDWAPSQRSGLRGLPGGGPVSTPPHGQRRSGADRNLALSGAPAPHLRLGAGSHVDGFLEQEGRRGCRMASQLITLLIGPGLAPRAPAPLPSVPLYLPSGLESPSLWNTGPEAS